ncbi:MAG: aldo/keto reductase [Neisseria sp.]|nr:aldo/keto reductase [Neisseria sp.]
MQYTTLSNGVKMPMLGYGVFLIGNDECEQLVLDAIATGYRHIDTAQAYWNEEGVGNAIAKCGLPREELFITTKVWISNAGSYQQAAASIEESLRKLQTDYVDLLLIHQPFNNYYAAYQAVVDAYKAGKAKAIGVSNFYGERLVDLHHFAEVAPMVCQLETHVFSQRREIRPFLEKYHIQHIAWSPLAQGKNDIFHHPVLKPIAEKHGKSISQIALRFLVQSGITAIPKSSSKARMAENLAVFDFALSDDEMAQIQALDSDKNLIANHQDPAFIEMLFERFGL